MPDHSKSSNGRAKVVYEENMKQLPDQTVFPTNEISSPGSYDSDDGLEMVPVTVMGAAWGRSAGANMEDDVVEDESRPSNERLLITAFVSFMSFTILQTVAAFVAGSEAMMGDSAAMAIDALTYLFNFFAERRKSRFEEYYQRTHSLASLPKDPARRLRLKQRAKRKMTLRMELIPPILSVTTLVFVTAIVLHGSIHMLQLDAHRDRTEQGDPNVNLMLIFSSLNLVLDIVNVMCFARAKRLCGYETIPKHVVPGEIIQPTNSNGSLSPLPNPRAQYAQLGQTQDLSSDEEEDDFFTQALKQADDEEIFEDEEQQGGRSKKRQMKSDAASDDTDPISNHAPKLKNGNGIHRPHHNGDDDDTEDGIQEEANLNMCSAYTVSGVSACCILYLCLASSVLLTMFYFTHHVYVCSTCLRIRCAVLPSLLQQSLLKRQMVSHQRKRMQQLLWLFRV